HVIMPAEAEAVETGKACGAKARFDRASVGPAAVDFVEDGGQTGTVPRRRERLNNDFFMALDVDLDDERLLAFEKRIDPGDAEDTDFFPRSGTRRGAPQACSAAMRPIGCNRGHSRVE